MSASPEHPVLHARRLFDAGQFEDARAVIAAAPPTEEALRVLLTLYRQVRTSHPAVAALALADLTSRWPGDARIVPLAARRQTNEALRDEDFEGRTAVARALAAGPLADGPPRQQLLLAGMLNQLLALEEARAAIDRALIVASKPEEAMLAFRAIGLAFERGDRGTRYERLLAIVSPAVAADPLALRIALGLLLALERFAAFRALYADREAAGRLASDDGLHIIARRLAAPMADVFREPRIIGIGLPKTATTSLAAALDRLGYLNADHRSPITFQYVSLDDAVLYDSVTDCGASQAFEAAYHLYPNAVFVRTHRPRDQWVASLEKHHRRVLGVGTFDELRATTTWDGGGRNGLAHKAVRFQTLLAYPSPANAHAAHEARVATFFGDKPTGKLLDLDVFSGQGWPELCGFLGKPVRDEPFPHLNRGTAEDAAD